MLALETKQSGGKLLPHSDLRGGGGGFPGGGTRPPTKGGKKNWGENFPPPLAAGGGGGSVSRGSIAQQFTLHHGVSK